MWRGTGRFIHEDLKVLGCEMDGTQIEDVRRLCSVEGRRIKDEVEKFVSISTFQAERSKTTHGGIFLKVKKYIKNN